MIVHAVFSASVDAELLERLAARGREVRFHPVSRRPDRAARLVDDLAASADAPDAVLHALDRGAWPVASAAGRALHLPTVLRVAEGPEHPERPDHPALLACLREADVVTVTSLGSRRDLVRCGVPGERLVVVPEPPGPFTAPVRRPPGQGRVVLLDDGRPPGRAAGLLQARSGFLKSPAAVSVSPVTALPRERMTMIDAADVVVCGADADREAVQAMWRGRAVVAPASDVMAEVVEDRCTGRLFRGGDEEDLLVALAQLLGSPFLVHAHGLAGRRLAESRFGADRIGAALDALFARVGRAAVR